MIYFLQNYSLLTLILFPVLLIFKWWCGVFICFCFGFLFVNNKLLSFIIAGASLSTCWTVCLFYKYFNGGEIIIDRVSNMMNLNSAILHLLIIILPLLVGGLAGFSGSQLKKSIF